MLKIFAKLQQTLEAYAPAEEQTEAKAEGGGGFFGGLFGGGNAKAVSEELGQEPATRV